MVSRIDRFGPPTAFFVPDRVPAVPAFDRDEPALGASQLGFDSGLSSSAASSLYFAPAVPALVASPAMERAVVDAALSGGQSELASAVDGAWARQMPSFSASGSFLSNGSSDPLAAQANAFNNSEAVVMTSAEQTLEHRAAEQIIRNIA